MKFKDSAISHDWSPVYNTIGSNKKAEAYQDLVMAAMADCYPVVTIKRKSTEDPWITEKIRKRIRQRKAVFKQHGRSAAWKKLKKVTNKMIKYRRDKYMEKHRIIITSPDASRNFFRNVRTYNTVEKPKIWDIKTLCPDLSDAQLASELSFYFNKISNEFSPLKDSEIPKTYHRDLPVLRPYQVAGRIRSIRSQ